MTGDEQVASPEGAGGGEASEATETPDASVGSADLPDGDDAALATQLAERTADLQRLQAEYVNYRKRVERDRALARTAGEASVLRSLLTVLDDIGRAEQHGELQGGFKAVADALQQALKAHRLESFGAPGEAFDPKLHEALFHAGESADAEVTTIDSVVRTGYRMGDEVLRHAQVGVVDPASAATQPSADSDESADDQPE